MRLTRLSVAALLGIAAFTALPVQADTPVSPGHFFVTAGANYWKFDSKRNTDDNGGPVIGLGYRINDDWGVELSYTLIKLRAGQNKGNAHGRDRLRVPRLGGLYFFDDNSGLMPYLTAGIGRQDGFVSDSGGGGNSESMADIGGGVMYNFNGRTSLRAEVREQYGFSLKKFEPIAALTFMHAIGDAGTPAAEAAPVAPAAPPAAAPAEPVAAAPVDSDGDGVMDDKDKCPGTPRGTVVDENGCAKQIVEQVTIDLLLEFDYNKSNIRDEHKPEIKRVADFMRKFPDSKAVLEGHTDSRGSDSYNQALSERRADAVRNSLIKDEGIDASRVSTVGYGESKPKVANDSEENMQRNRRVSAVVDGGTQVTVKVK